MKQLLITITSVLLVGCGPSVPDISIHKDAEEGNIKDVKQHLAAGTDVNAKDMGGSTILHIAAIEGHKEVVGLLIAKGADVNVKGTVGTALDLAIASKKTVIANLLRKHGGKTGEELKAAGN